MHLQALAQLQLHFDAPKSLLKDVFLTTPAGKEQNSMESFGTWDKLPSSVGLFHHISRLQELKSKDDNPRIKDIPSLLISLSLLCILPLSLFVFFHSSSPILSSSPNPQINLLQTPNPNPIKVYVADLPRSLNYGLLENYWALDSDSRIGSEADNEIRKTHIGKSVKKFLPYPENPIIKQYSAEYWILGDLMTPEKLKLGSSFAKRAFSAEEADVIFVPFLATLSAEMQLIVNKGVFRKKKKAAGNEDYEWLWISRSKLRLGRT
ncbi:hypothetical protein CQW23_01409 [Capsicum baccatum]|uniref:Exostosin GT47 domain-containing protein n=1 Tax=Capsicum baccatum TaxID=33114 RepID=A0A2G2XNH5_CAPBA|nr:hypothetical protein CQW23_01409 [Capsicum baccatum]